MTWKRSEIGGRLKYRFGRAKDLKRPVYHESEGSQDVIKEYPDGGYTMVSWGQVRGDREDEADRHGMIVDEDLDDEKLYPIYYFEKELTAVQLRDLQLDGNFDIKEMIKEWPDGSRDLVTRRQGEFIVLARLKKED